MKRFFPLLLVLLMLTGCSGTANRNNIINLLSSPKLSERESRIITAINGYLGGDVILKYPKQGDISPVQVVDLNNDMVDEAVVLYNEPSAGSYVRMAVLTQDEKGWRVSYDTEGFGTEVYRIEFDNLTNTDEKEIVVSYTFADSQDKILSVYFMKDGKSDSEHTQTCQHYVLHDMTGDGAADIVLAGVNADNQRTQIKVLSTHYTGSYLTTLATKQVNIRNATVNNIAFTRSDFT
ncbi:MAG: hypothetical protein IJD80_00930, partial [Oscillospiraceae bacterium]|nr:hypothetical protein [Oscillospiraceae bacterium]